jgi:hypothetical protein
MTSPDVFDIAPLLETVAPKSFFVELCARLNLPFGSGIFNVAVVTWLMVLQRLQAHKTLVAALQALRQGQATAVLNNCKRVREKSISPQRWRFLSGAKALA